MKCDAPVIREYERSDQERVVRFFAAVFGELGHDFNLATKDRDLADIPGAYLAGGGVFLMALEREEVVGTCAVRHLDEQTCELKRFYVRQDRQRCGIGSALIDRALAHARAGRWRRVRLDTTKKAKAAMSLFVRQGFVEIPRYNDDPYAQVFMEFRIG